MARKDVTVVRDNPPGVATALNGPCASDEAAARLADSRARMRELLKDPAFAEAARAAMEREELSDDLVERARAGEFAEQAFLEGYGSQFVRNLKP